MFTIRLKTGRPTKGLTPQRIRRALFTHITDAELAALSRYSAEYQTSKIDLVTWIIREWLTSERNRQPLESLGYLGVGRITRMTKTEGVPTLIRVPRADYERLRKLAEIEDRPIRELIRQAIKLLLQAKQID